MSDPYVADVELLCNFDGVDAATSYSSEIGPDPVFVGLAEIDTGVTYFSGLGSLLLSGGSNSNCTFGAAGDWNFLSDGTEDYTVEVIARPTQFSSGSRGMVNTYDSAGARGFELYFADTGTLFLRLNAVFLSCGGGTLNQWHYISVTYVNSTGTVTLKRYTSGGSNQTASNTLTVNTLNTPSLSVGWHRRTGTYFRGNIDCVRVTRGVARTITGFPADPWDGGQAFTCYILAPYPLQNERLIGFNNFSAVVSGFSRPGVTMVRSQYYMEISGSPVLRVPISSWQATKQLDRTQYLQCVVPAVDDYVSAIAARQGASNFTIYRTATLPSGFVHNVKVAESLLESAAFSEGGRNYSCTLSGYPDGVSAPTIPVSYELAGVRYIRENSTGTYVARCAIDWLLRPGDLVTTGDISFAADYINYFANDRDSYMDVGSR